MTTEDEQLEADELAPATPGRMPEPRPEPHTEQADEDDQDAAVADAVSDTWDA